MIITLLVSGALGHICLDHLIKVHKVKFVFTDKRSDAIIQLCQRYKIPHFIGNPRGGRTQGILSQADCEVLLSVNYLFLVDQEVIDLASRYAINLHGSLLPRYRGRTPHVWAVINGETVTGVTAHLMTLEMDAGKIVGRQEVPISIHTTGADILKEYQSIYPALVEDVLAKVESGQINPIAQDERLASYFPKRTPEDGAIKWTWSRDRVRNWIRAQASPYPGAFFTFEGQRYTVQWASLDPLGFRYEHPDGLVLDIDQNAIIVKLSDGALRIGPFNQNDLTRFTIGDKLS